ncbi:MAG: UvrD-helicase domain-containing protein [Deltaproteobacteria bacterium]|nr:UvrD-helicase domain-containing protein [Deltaproteobacteria bacterium]
MTVLLDEIERERAVRERGRNVVVEASAGTGKTKLVVDRLLALVAPEDDHPPVDIDRIAAITFTRKAAGELRVRTRQSLLGALASTAAESPRGLALRRALGGIDTACITTIHGFADRLLRSWPAHARLDPRYELADDTSALVAECLDMLVHGAETGALAAHLRGSRVADRADEAAATVLDARRAGLRVRSLDTEHWTYHGLDGLIDAFATHRDVDPREPAALPFERAELVRAAGTYLERAAALSAETPGSVWLRETADILRRALDDDDPAAIFAELVDRLERGPRGRASDPPRRKHEFDGDAAGWALWKTFATDDDGPALRDELLAPLRRWMAIRLVRLRPVVLHLYELAKRRRGVVDHVDLLLRLRDLLRDHPPIRRACQGYFDHIFVDEFQDTDPLQAQIILYLCEGAATVAPGKLTIVGDPKQSIYRFRRADIRTYRRVVETVARGPHLEIELTSSFRSHPGLVGWINERFDDLFAAPHGPVDGDVAYRRLTAGRTGRERATVHAVAFDLPDESDLEAWRVLEAEVTARYVRWLVEVGDVEIVDPVTGVPRRIRYGDVGVLALSTTNLPHLFDAFDRDGVPYAARGGSVFLSDPLLRRFLLGLCALADRDDGVAVAALLRPPYFAIGLADLARETDAAAAARAIVGELRRHRFARSPGATARALLERTGLGRVIALGANGAQRLAAARELCLRIAARALDEHLDFDGVMQRCRGWIAHPPQLDRPHPVGDAAVRVMTVHQAKGLEFPVVVLWDARAGWRERATYEPWVADGDGRGWELRLDHLRWAEPPELALSDAERALRTLERRRLVYVAATRARDLLVVPKAGAPDARWIFGSLLRRTDSATVRETARHTRESHAPWFDEAAPLEPSPPQISERDVELAASWEAAAASACADVLRPVPFASGARQALIGKHGRFGSRFGETVHLAIGLVLQRTIPVEDAVHIAAARTGLTTHRRDACDDVRRALATLAQLGVESIELEYPIAAASPTGQLAAGYVDLLGVVATRPVLLDFKTDLPPRSDEPLPAHHVAQVRGYASALRSTVGVVAAAGLLYTASGELRWLSSDDHDHI